MQARPAKALVALFQTIVLLFQVRKKNRIIVSKKSKKSSQNYGYQLFTCSAWSSLKFLNKNMRKIIWIFKTHLISDFRDIKICGLE